MKLVFSIIFLAIIFSSCSVDPEIKPIAAADDIKEIIPDGWPNPIYNFNNNPLTPNGFILGRELFYDPILSYNNTVSCGTCHQQFAAFANGGHSVSHGVNGLLGKRNSPALQNLNWHPSFMHDGGVINLELQPIAPISNPIEMHETIANVVSKLNSSSKYRDLFKKAYGDETVNSQRMLKAMAQFMGTMYSYNSKYDNVKNGKDAFNANEQAGYSLFIQKCANCHTEPLFSDFQYRSNGLSVDPLLKDSGRAHITQLPQDLYKFKTPSLRNIEKTSPYMHDGRFNTLDECLDHYNSGITNTINLDPILVSGIALSTQQKADLISFLKTLTDYKFINDTRFADPN